MNDEKLVNYVLSIGYEFFFFCVLKKSNLTDRKREFRIYMNISIECKRKFNKICSEWKHAALQNPEKGEKEKNPSNTNKLDIFNESMWIEFQ